MTPRLSRRQVALADRRTWEWRRPDTSGWTGTQQQRYQRFERALVDYLADEKVKVIERRYALRISQVQEQLARAMTKDANGQLLGFCALIPSLHLRVQKREKAMPIGANPNASICKGGLKRILDDEDLYDALEERVLGADARTREARVSVLGIQKWLMAELTERGYKSTDYPFTTKIPLYSSLSRLVKKIKQENMATYLKVYGEGHQATNLNVMSGKGSQMARPLPLEEVEIDEHKLHGIAVVRIKVDGILKKVPAERAVGIAIIDRGSHSVLGAAVCLNPEAKAEALVEAMRSAVVPDHVVKLPSGQPAPPFRPGDFDPALKGAAWSVAFIDNAKIHVSDQYLDAAARIGSQTCYGPIRSWSARPNIENLFSRLVRGKFDRLPSTTSRISDLKRGHAPADRAIAHEIDHDEICLAFYKVLAEANTGTNRGLLNQSPIHVLSDYLKGPSRPLLRRLPPVTAANADVGVRVIQVFVRKRSKDNPNLYVSHAGNKYSNSVLSRRADLLGQQITIHVSPNLRTLDAFELTGRPLGTLVADGIWGRTDHTNEIKQAVNRDLRLNFGQHGTSADPIQALMQKKARNVLKKHTSRPLGGVVKGALALQRMMEVTGTEEIDIKQTQQQPKVTPTSTGQAAALARAVKAARERRNGGNG